MNDRTCVIYNSHAGRGKALKAIEAAKSALAADAELWPTDGPDHAVRLATKAAQEGFQRVIAAGGDGTVHEVVNGLMLGPTPTPTLGVWPLGSMNDLAFSLGMLKWWKLKVKPPLEPFAIDIGRARCGDRTKYFINSCGIGFNGMVTIESRKIRWLSGLPLYVLGFLKSMVKHFAAPPLSIDMGNGPTVTPTFALSLCLGQNEGGFPLGKGALLDDGLFHYLHVKNIARWELIRYLPNLIMGTLPTTHPKIITGQTVLANLISTVPLCVHLDGEFICLPEENRTTLEVDLLPKRLNVEVYGPGLYGGN